MWNFQKSKKLHDVYKGAYKSRAVSEEVSANSQVTWLTLWK